MLVLRRSPGEQIQIGEEITVVIQSVRGKRVHVGIIAPREMNISRSELLEDQIPKYICGECKANISEPSFLLADGITRLCPACYYKPTDKTGSNK